MNRIRQLSCASVAALLMVVVVGVDRPLARAAECGTSIGGDVGGGDGTYGGGGNTSSCSGGSPGASDNGGSNYLVTRFLRAEPLLCAGTPDALMEIIEYRDPATGALVSRVSRCVSAIVPGDPLPPPPPSTTEVLRRAPLPLPEVHTSPPGQGLVGFETYLWWGGNDAPPPITVTVGEWSATVTPTLLAIDWDMGNGDHVTGDGPGSEDHPSARYTYGTHCECTITVTLTWGGTVILSHPLLGTPIVQPAAGVPFTTSTAYTVVEREAVVVG